MPHVVLLGDSILDNASYVGGGSCVIEHVVGQLPIGWEASLEAVDGSIVQDVHVQLRRVPVEATHLILSVGGNDALRNIGIIDEPVRSTGESLERLASLAEAFEVDYRKLITALLGLKRPVAVCTIYYPNFDEPRLQRLGVTALTVFNDAILRVAFQHQLPVIDLRLICSSPDDYANPIEPSVSGGEKIAGGIVNALNAMEVPGHNSVVIGPQ